MLGILSPKRIIENPFILVKLAIFIFGSAPLVVIGLSYLVLQVKLNYEQPVISINEAASFQTPVSKYNLFEHLSKTNPIEREGPSFFVENGGVIGPINKRHSILCSVGVLKRCKTNQIAESIDVLISFNPIYYMYQGKDQVRFQTHLNFIDYLKTIGIKTQVVEAIVPSRGQKFVATKPGNDPWEVQIEVKTPMYYRENLVNVGARKIWDKWEYLLMIDGHHYFENTYWWEETIWKLEHYPGVQLYQNGTHLDIKNDTDPGFELYSVAEIRSFRNNVKGQPRYTGNAWAMKKADYEKIGYIIDYCVAAGGDGTFYMGTLKEKDVKVELLEPTLLANKIYFDQLNDWIWNASKVFNGELRVVRGKIVHFWHEAYFDYLTLVKKMNGEASFDYKRDLMRDENYTLHLTNQKIIDIFDASFYGDQDVKFKSLSLVLLSYFANSCVAFLRWIAPYLPIYIYNY